MREIGFDARLDLFLNSPEYQSTFGPHRVPIRYGVISYHHQDVPVAFTLSLQSGQLVITSKQPKPLEIKSTHGISVGSTTQLSPEECFTVESHGPGADFRGALVRRPDGGLWPINYSGPYGDYKFDWECVLISEKTNRPARRVYSPCVYIYFVSYFSIAGLENIIWFSSFLNPTHKPAERARIYPSWVDR